jgi:hypothetical protein
MRAKMYVTYYESMRDAEQIRSISRRDLTMLCDWLAYYGAGDRGMSEHYMWLVDLIRDSRGLDRAVLLPENLLPIPYPETPKMFRDDPDRPLRPWPPE